MGTKVSVKIEPETTAEKLNEQMVEAIGFLALVENYIEQGKIKLGAESDEEKAAIMAVLVAARKYADQRKASVKIGNKQIIMS